MPTWRNLEKMSSFPPREVRSRELAAAGSGGVSEGGEEFEPVVYRRLRPKSSSYEALRSAVFQLTRMADFQVETLLGSGFFADVYKVRFYGNTPGTMNNG